MTDDLTDDIESDTLRQAELMQTSALLERLVGRTITETRVEETRIALRMDDDATYYFYGFMGKDESEP